MCPEEQCQIPHAWQEWETQERVMGDTQLLKDATCIMSCHAGSLKSQIFHQPKECLIVSVLFCCWVSGSWMLSWRSQGGTLCSLDEPLEQEDVHCSQGCSEGIMWVWGSDLTPQAVIDFRASPDVFLLNLGKKLVSVLVFSQEFCL